MKITKIKLQLNTSTGPGFGTPIYVLTYPVDLKLKRSRKHPGRFELDEGVTVIVNNDTFAAGGDIIYRHPNTIKRSVRSLVGITGTDRQLGLLFRAVGFIDVTGECRIDFALIDATPVADDDTASELLSKLINRPHVIDIEYSK